MNMIDVRKFVEELKDYGDELHKELERLESLYNAQADLDNNFFENVDGVRVIVTFTDLVDDEEYEQSFNVPKWRMKRMVAEDIYDTENRIKQQVDRIKAGMHP